MIKVRCISVSPGGNYGAKVGDIIEVDAGLAEALTCRGFEIVKTEPPKKKRKPASTKAEE